MISWSIAAAIFAVVGIPLVILAFDVWTMSAEKKKLAKNKEPARDEDAARQEDATAIEPQGEKTAEEDQKPA